MDGLGRLGWWPMKKSHLDCYSSVGMYLGMYVFGFGFDVYELCVRKHDVDLICMNCMYANIK
jgi:hypothetical protein